MSYERDYEDDMPRYPLDDATADRLLAGRLAPDDAPAGYGHLASLIASATGPATPAELAGGEMMARVAAAAVGAGVSAPSPSSRGKSMISKLVTAKFAAAATVAAFGLGTAAAAATGSLPGQQPPHHGAVIADEVEPTTTSSSTTSTTAPSGTTTTEPSSPDVSPSGGSATGSADTPSLPMTGPANANAQFGLCTAFLAHHPTATASGPGESDQAPPFQALIDQNGGMSGTYTYCQGVVTSRSTSTTSTTTGTGSEPDSPDNVTPVHPPESTGRPSDPGSSSQSDGSSGHSTGDSGSHTPTQAGGAAATHGH